MLTPHKRPTDADVCRAGWVQEGALTLEQVKVRLYRSRECVAAAPADAPVARGGASGACDEEAEPRRAGETEPAKKRRRRKKRGRDAGAGSGEARRLE